jgi:hypothetical protein
MKCTLTVSVALAAVLGMTGLAQAQLANPNAPYKSDQPYETPGKPSAGYQAAPSVATSPALPTNSNPYWRTSTPNINTPQSQTPTH